MTERFAISRDARLAQQFDRLIRAKGYRNRYRIAPKRCATSRASSSKPTASTRQRRRIALVALALAPWRDTYADET